MSAVVTVDDPWVAALDEFERRLEGYRDVLDHDSVPVTGSWPPPEVSGRQLPAELVPRARLLLGRAGELESLIRIRQDALRIRAILPRPHRRIPARPTRSTEL